MFSYTLSGNLWVSFWAWFANVYWTSVPYLPDITQSNLKVSKGVKIRNRNNQVPHLTKDTNGKVTNSQLDTTDESQEVSPFPTGDHKAHTNRRAQRHSKRKTELEHIWWRAIANLHALEEI